MLPAEASTAPFAPRKNQQSLAELAQSLSVTGLKVVCGYICLLALLTAIHFPYHVDALGSPKARQDAGAFYTDIYATAAPQKAPPQVPASPEDSKYVKLAREGIITERIVPKVSAFAEKYSLAGKRVLDVGAGTGYLQDIVPDYVGLDISPSARGYFHKPFVEASATDMPFRDNEFDGLWSIWVLEHVPKPEQALVEIRRVVKDGGVLFLKPAWDCTWWLSQGYDVRPYSDFDLLGKLKKASLNIVKSPYYRGASLIPTRYVRQMQAAISGQPTRFHYRLLEPNYEHYWVSDADAVNGLDYYEMLLWFTSRGDECLNCGVDPLWDADELILRIHKKQPNPS
jgi:SAM-dependent methyltransferase